MPLIKSISGIRGTIGGQPGKNLTPLDIVQLVAAYAEVISRNNPPVSPAGSTQPLKIIIGRDSRISGEMIKDLVAGTLLSQGLDVVDIGVASSPTVEMAVSQQQARGGIILSASHNPQGWNALKLLNDQGEIFSADLGRQVLARADQASGTLVTEEHLGSYAFQPELGAEHLRAVLAVPLVDPAAIAVRNFKIVVDGINSVGGIIVPELLRQLGVKEIIELNCEPTGRFAHQPEPLAKNLTAIQDKVRAAKADLGIVVDPDVDRLAFIDETGTMISEEYTLVMAADYILQNFSQVEASYPGRYQKNIVSNLSSSRALADITAARGGVYAAAAVGEVNVATKMKELGAVIGGEGNGGVIYAPLHYGRDALIGMAIILTALAKSGRSLSEFKKQFPEYFMVKDRLDLTPGLEVPVLLNRLAADYVGAKLTTLDGLKIDWPDSWVHLRPSNTEPIMRIYGEARDLGVVQAKVKEVKNKILSYIK
jgi:phosphomannomutase